MRIARGASPGNLPVEQPTRFELAVNLRTAKVLDIDIPSPIPSRADEVIEWARCRQPAGAAPRPKASSMIALRRRRVSGGGGSKSFSS